MRRENLYFKISPLVVQSDKKSVIEIKPLFEHVAWSKSDKLSVSYIASNGILPDGTPVATPSKYSSEPEWRLENGTLKIRQFFAGEQRHCITVKKFNQYEKKEDLCGLFYIYSVQKDLYGLRAFKGDFHIHSFRSDGIESPAYVAAAARRIGMDFMTITDHQRYEPSLEAIKAFEKIPLSMKIFPGEEVHSVDNPVHIVNFGGRFSVNSACRGDFKDAYFADVAARMKKMKKVPEPLRFAVAASEWCFDKIREAGGLAIFCHPYWFLNGSGASFISEPLVSAILERCGFDAFEGMNFSCRHESDVSLYIQRYYHEAANGKRYPIVCSSDAHGCDSGAKEYFNGGAGIILSESDEFESIIESVKKGRSLVWEKTSGEEYRVYGEFRLVKIAQFLIDEYFPEHDRLCRIEGELMNSYLKGDDASGKALKLLKDQVPSLREDCWASKKF